MSFRRNGRHFHQVAEHPFMLAVLLRPSRFDLPWIVPKFDPQDLPYRQPGNGTEGKKYAFVDQDALLHSIGFKDLGKGGLASLQRNRRICWVPQLKATVHFADDERITIMAVEHIELTVVSGRPNRIRRPTCRLGTAGICRRKRMGLGSSACEYLPSSRVLARSSTDAVFNIHRGFFGPEHRWLCLAFLRLWQSHRQSGGGKEVGGVKALSNPQHQILDNAKQTFNPSFDWCQGTHITRWMG